MKCRIQIYKNIGNLSLWLARASLETIDVRFVELAASALSLTSKQTALRSQHVNATYRNIVGRNMLRAFGHHVALCCDMLGVVGSNLTTFKLLPSFLPWFVCLYFH